jgi:hypothetical protein
MSSQEAVLHDFDFGFFFLDDYLLKMVFLLAKSFKIIDLVLVVCDFVLSTWVFIVFDLPSRVAWLDQQNYDYDYES